MIITSENVDQKIEEVIENLLLNELQNQGTNVSKELFDDILESLRSNTIDFLENEVFSFLADWEERREL